MGRRAAEGLALVGHQGGDDLVEDADLVREDELKLVRRGLVDLLDLSFPEEADPPTRTTEAGRAT
jgi:hypothetical protein